MILSARAAGNALRHQGADASHCQEPNDDCCSNNVHQREHSDPRKGCPRKATSGSVAQKPYVRQGQQQQNPNGDPTKENLGPIRVSTYDAEDSGGSKRAHNREEDRRARSSQGGHSVAMSRVATAAQRTARVAMIDPTSTLSPTTHSLSFRVMSSRSDSLGCCRTRPTSRRSCARLDIPGALSGRTMCERPERHSDSR